MLRAHGADHSVHSRHTSTKIQHESFPIVGYNYRMSDIHAALGLSQLQKLAKVLLSRKVQAARYTRAFNHHPRLIVPYVPKGCYHTFQSYLLRIENGKNIRDRLMQAMLDHGIATRQGIPSAHLEPPYRKMYPTLSLPHTEKASQETLVLPMFTEMTKKEQDFVIKTLLKELNKIINEAI
jgi:dTDP-4-amino-4,6-dideoxygalactose transaminase